MSINDRLDQHFNDIDQVLPELKGDAKTAVLSLDDEAKSKLEVLIAKIKNDLHKVRVYIGSKL